MAKTSRNNAFMRRIGFIWIVGIFLLLFVVPVSAQEIPDFNTDSLTMDSIAMDSLDPDPEWYVEPLVREADFAPRRAAAANCPVDSVLTFNVDSVLVEVTMYEYGDTTRTMVWTVNADGSRIGKSRTESASTATTSYSATYAWDANTNNWKGTSKEEHTYANNKETTRIIYSTWLNNEWVADTKYTWAYDAAGRESEYTTYTRNTSTNELVLSQQRIREWYNNSKLTLDIQYTAHNGTDWSAGTKKEYAYDASGNQIEYTYYSSLSNGNWVGSTHEKWTYTSGKKTYYEKQTWSNGGWVNSTKEIWAYNGPSAKQTLYEKYTGSGSTWTGSSKEIWEYTTSSKQTLHEKFGWSNGDWSLTLQENSGYDVAGNNILIENYSLTNNVWTGTKKEEYTFNAAKKKTSTVIYSWTNGAWVGKSKELWAFNTGNKQTLHEKYNWSNDDWAITLQENSGYDDAGNNTLIENYSISNGVWTGTKKEEYVFNYKKKTITIKSKWSNGAWVYSTKAVTDIDAAGNSIETANYNWSNDTWVGTGTRTLKTYNSSKKVTEEITQNWPSGATDWVNKTCTTTVYSGANKTQEVYYTWANDTWEGVKRTDYHFNAAGLNDTTMTYAPDGIGWIQSTRIVNTYDTKGNLILAHGAGWNGFAWVLITMQKQDVLYDANDNLILVASWKCNDDSVWYGVQKDTSAYLNGNPNKPLYRARFTSWTNNEWIPSYRIEYEYDEAERTLLNQRFEWKSSMWKGIYRYEYEYSAQGKELMSAYYNGWSTATDSWVGSSKKETTYNNEGQTTSMTNYNWQNNDWHATNRYFYKYDANNRTIEQVVQNYTNDEWGNSLRFETLYKGSIVIKSNDYTWLNNAWQFTRRNEKVYDDDAQAKLRREITGSWNTSGIVSSYIDNLYSYSCDPKYYTIRFVNYDGTELMSESIVEGETPSYNGEEPTKQEDAEFTYSFAGWTPSIIPVTANATYTATFTGTKRTYTITWLNEDGSEIEHETLEYGATPAHADINKESTAEFTYTFAGWTPGIGIVTGDASYTATFSATKNSYTITWLNDDNTEIDRTLVEYGVVPTHTAPTKENTAEWTYTFTGWDPAVTSVTGDASYTATYTATKRSYTITWLNEDGTEISHETMEYGATPSHADINKGSTAEFTYTFAGWTPQIVTVTGDASYTASFTATKNKYTIIFLNYDGTELQSSEVEYGVTPNYEGAIPTKPADAQDTYSFAGWDQEIIPVAGTKTYTATFTATKNSYYIIWLNDDNTEIDRTLVEYGVVPTHTAPTKEATDEHSYFFDKWAPDVVAVTGEATYKATYTETTKVYTITWLNEDGIEISYESLEYGATPSHTAPTKDATDEFTYTFAGWNPSVVPVTGNATYTATFTSNKRSYTITWLNEDGSEIEHETLEYGATPAHADISKESTAEFTYTFAGWTPGIGIVTGDATYTAQFSATKNSYYIIWLNDDNTEIDRTLVEYGVVPTHADPTKQATDAHSYSFAGWTPQITAVTGDATYTATFSATKNSYTITWLNEDGSEIEHETLEYGATPSHADVTKESTAEYTYAFAGWTPQRVTVTGDASYTASFTATKNKYTIIFLNYDGTELQSSEVEYGVTPNYEGATPTKPADAQDTYTFAGWDTEIIPVTGTKTYTATFTGTKNSYTITWLNDDNTLIDQTTVEYGAMPQHEAATKQNTAEFTYTFTGWSPAITAVTGDASYQATFSATKNSYTITWLNEDGTEISHETMEYGATPSHADINKESTAEFTYTFAGWNPAVTSVTGDASYTATFSATKNSYTITWLDDDNTQIDQTTVEYGVVPTHDDPAKQATAEFTYTFAGWDNTPIAVTGPATYKATYTSAKNSYTITWLDDTGTLVDQTKVAYGATPMHANIYKESDDQYDYTFVGWTPTLVPVTGDASYSAIFTTAGKSYTVTFYFEDGVTILDQMTLPYGAIPSTPYIPSIPSDANHTYTFSGWSPEIAPVTGDISYVPTFTAIPNQYTVIFRNYNGKELQRKKVDYGTIPEYEGDEPSRSATNAYTWAFEGWTPELTAVIGDATYTAVYTKVMNTYTILFYDEDGTTLLDEVTVEHGQKPTTSVIPTKEADEEYRYTFAGWSPKIAKATADAEYKATYLATPKTQGLGDVQRDDVQCTKVLLDGTIYIRRGGNTYSIDGQRVK